MSTETNAIPQPFSQEQLITAEGYSTTQNLLRETASSLSQDDSIQVEDNLSSPSTSGPNSTAQNPNISNDAELESGMQAIYHQKIRPLEELALEFLRRYATI